MNYLLNNYQPILLAKSVEEALVTFLESHPEIGITDPRKQLIEFGRQADTHIKHWTIISYQQVPTDIV